MDIVNTLKCLTEKNTREAREYVKNIITPLSDEVFENSDGSVIGVKKGKENGKRIMLDAHIDEICLMISEIDEHGFLKFSAVGGISEKCLPGTEAWVFGKEKLKGVIGSVPPHLQKGGEKKGFKAEDMLIDIGMEKKDAEKLVKIGDLVKIGGKFLKLSNDVYSSPALDNRAGVLSLLMIMESLKDVSLEDSLYFVFSSGEEYDMSGAALAAEKIKPDMAFVVDVTFGVSYKVKDYSFELGRGPSCSMGPNISKELYKEIEKSAEENGITIFPEVSGGSSGTNAWAIQVSGTGVKCAVLSIPLRYMHTNVETVNINDIKSVSRLLCDVIKRRGNDA